MPGWPRIVAGTVQWSSVAVGDLDNDHRPDVVVSGEDGSVWAWSAAGAVLPGFPVNVGGSDVSSGHSAVLADVDGDGFNEIVTGVGSGIAVLEHTGAVKAGWPKLVDVDSVPALGDLDGDGRLEVAAYGKDDKVYVWAVEGGAGERKMPWPMLGQNAMHTGRSLNRPPVANAGPDRAIELGASVVLDGSASFDPDGGRCPTNGAIRMGHCWPRRSTVTVSPATGAHVYTLTVFDEQDGLGRDFVTVTVNDVGAPTVSVTAPAGETLAIGVTSDAPDGRPSTTSSSPGSTCPCHWTAASPTLRCRAARDWREARATAPGPSRRRPPARDACVSSRATGPATPVRAWARSRASSPRSR